MPVNIETTTDNPAILQSHIADILVAPLQESSQFLAAGPRILDSSEPVRIPRIASTIDPGIVGEAQPIDDADIAFDEIGLLPSSLRSIKTLIKFSSEIARSSAIGLDQVLRERLITDVALKLDALLFDGTGVDDSIRGIFRHPDIVTGAVDLSDVDSLIDALAVAQANFVSPTHWVMTPASFAKLRKIKVGVDDARYVIDPNGGYQGGTSFRLLGLPVVITSHIPDDAGKARVALIDVNKLVVVRDIDSSVKLLDQTFAADDVLAIRIATRFDVGLLRSEAVTVLTEPGAVAKTSAK